MTRGERPLVRILVVVASTQARTLRAEAEKGFAGTAVGAESVGPKAWVKSIGRELGRFRPIGSPAEREPAKIPGPGRPVQAATRSSWGTSTAIPGRVVFSS